MAKLDPIGDAYRRCQILRMIVDHHRDMSRLPSYRQNLVKYGFIQQGEKEKDAENIIQKTFDELAGLIAHLTIIDMAAALELAAKSKIGNASGHVRKAYREYKGNENKAIYAKRLIMNQEYFRDLRSLSQLIEPFVDKNIMAAFESTRDARNNFAHGTNVSVMPVIDVLDARDALQEIFEIL